MKTKRVNMTELRKTFMKLPVETRPHLISVVKRRSSFKLIPGNHDAPNRTINTMASLRRAGFAVIDGKE